ncbi:hypothetical protein V5735_19250 [Haladaptatus sp. SPP-AMP-3]|uniref:FG-GAP repeat protein n=1 Tax=Haladaptatus sp. SPP-AMP-3 TaxID=3121295 RepID=UPI003C2BE481
MDEHENQTGEFTRRSALKTIGASTLAVGGFTGIGAACAQQWIPDQKILPVAGYGWQFGKATELVGNRAFVGGPTAGSENVFSGAVYVYLKEECGWAGSQQLTDPENQDYSFFGYSVSSDNNQVLISAPFASAESDFSGAVYEFAEGESGFTLTNKIASTDSVQLEGFGYSTSVENNTAVIGAPSVTSTSSNTKSDAGEDKALPGAGYIFTKQGGDWSQQAKLAPEGKTGQFGFSVDISENTAVVGAPATNTSEPSSGAAYVFTKQGDTWKQSAELTPENPKPWAKFGAEVSISGGRLLVGAPATASSETAAEVYEFTQSEKDWKLTAQLQSCAPNALFGHSIALKGDTALISASLKEDDVVYAISREEGKWVKDTENAFTPSGGARYTAFGVSMSLDQDEILVGAPYEDTNAVDAGAAYTLTNDSNQVVDSASKTTDSSTKSALESISVVSTSATGESTNYTLNYTISDTPTYNLSCITTPEQPETTWTTTEPPEKPTTTGPPETTTTQTGFPSTTTPLPNFPSPVINPPASPAPTLTFSPNNFLSPSGTFISQGFGNPLIRPRVRPPNINVIGDPGGNLLDPLAQSDFGSPRFNPPGPFAIGEPGGNLLDPLIRSDFGLGGAPTTDWATEKADSIGGYTNPPW